MSVQMDNEMKSTFYTMLAFVVGVLAGALLTFLAGSKIWKETMEQEMDALHEGWTQCLTAEERLTTCMLEYDGDGSTNLPRDYHWYWRAAPKPQVLTPEQTTLLWEED